MSERWTAPSGDQGTSAAASSHWSPAFQVRPVPFVITDTTYGLSAVAAQLILKEVNRLPRTAYQSADDTGRQIDRALRDGSSVYITGEQTRTLLVAIERIRLRSGRLPADLIPLRQALLSPPVTAA